MAEEGNLRSFGEYLTVGEAAGYLGVSTGTLRNWDRAGKFSPARHPLNGYRLYRRDELRSLLEAAAGDDRGHRRRSGPRG